MPAPSRGISGCLAELISVAFVAAALFAEPAAAQNDEDFRVELTLTDWLLHTYGTIQSGTLPIDLRSDLGVEQNVSTFYGRLVAKPARRHRIVVEGVPYRLTGARTLDRTITYAGRTYQVRETVQSDAEIDYIFGGYQFDFVSRDRGHLGLQAGGAFLDASGTLTVPARNLTGTESQQLGLPLVGLEGRGWLTGRVNLNGSVKGMAFGRFGHFVQGDLNIGIRLARWVIVQAGYMALDTEVQNNARTVAFSPRFSGPVFSLQFRDR